MSYDSLDSLTPEKLVQFETSLSGLSPDQVRSAKALLIHNAVAEFKMFVKRGDALETTLLMLCFLLIPIALWFLINGRNDARKELYLGRIRGAIRFWQADLEEEHFNCPELAV